jgi:RecJ-like exonuclease
LTRWDQRTLHFETGILFQGIESLAKNDHESARAHLSKNLTPSQDEDLVRRAIHYTKREWEAVDELKPQINLTGNISYVLNFPFTLGKAATYVRGIANTLVGIAGEQRRSYIDMSLRACDERVNLNQLLRKLAPPLGGSGGGHPKAAGARIPENKFTQFLVELNKSLSLSTKE